MSKPTRSFVPPPQEGSLSAGQPLALQTVGGTASAAPLGSPQAHIMTLNTSPATQLPDSPMSSVSHPATPSITSSHATDPAAGSPGTRSSKHWDCQSPPYQQPCAPNTQSQDASAFLSTPSRRRIRPRMRPIPTDSDEELLAPKVPPAAPSTAPRAQHLFVDLMCSSQLLSSTAAPSQPAPSVVPAQPAPGTPALGQPDSQEGSVINMMDSSKLTPHLWPVDSVVKHHNIHITTTESGEMMAADKLAHSKSGRPILNAPEYRLSSGGSLMPFFELSSGLAGAPTPANTPSPGGGSGTFSLPPMQLVLDFSKNAAPAGKSSALSGSKTLNAHSHKPNPPTSKVPKPAARKADPPAKPPAKRPRTSSKVEAAAAGLSERRKKDLDIPLESDEDVEMDGATDEGKGEDEDDDNGNSNGDGDGNGVQKSNHIPEAL
ncbi:hypothetical protein FRC08_013188 [Ceratobasidium sp. 394]|nr:hypothetical protein FRC08_013188 [Ceratobasidium sp. 394]